ncbi:uncharacterized protein METZ01_LOCUS378984, partial [marine metagenome]
MPSIKLKALQRKTNHKTVSGHPHHHKLTSHPPGKTSPSKCGPQPSQTAMASKSNIV